MTRLTTELILNTDVGEMVMVSHALSNRLSYYQVCMLSIECIIKLLAPSWRVGISKLMVNLTSGVIFSFFLFPFCIEVETTKAFRTIKVK